MSDEGNYIPLEWLHPKKLRDNVWSDVEAQLIYHFQPELNNRLKERNHAKNPVDIAFHNCSGTKSFDAGSISAHRIVRVRGNQSEGCVELSTHLKCEEVTTQLMSWSIGQAPVSFPLSTDYSDL